MAAAGGAAADPQTQSTLSGEGGSMRWRYRASPAPSSEIAAASDAAADPQTQSTLSGEKARPRSCSRLQQRGGGGTRGHSRASHAPSSAEKYAGRCERRC